MTEIRKEILQSFPFRRGIHTLDSEISERMVGAGGVWEVGCVDCELTWFYYVTPGKDKRLDVGYRGHACPKCGKQGTTLDYMERGVQWVRTGRVRRLFGAPDETRLCRVYASVADYVY